MNKKEIKKWVEYIYKSEPCAKNFIDATCGNHTEADLVKLLAPAVPYFIKKDEERRKATFAVKKQAFDHLLDGQGNGEARVIYAAKAAYKEGPKRCLRDLRDYMAGRPKAQIARIIKAIRSKQ